jgi:hypothetical protein
MLLYDTEEKAILIHRMVSSPSGSSLRGSSDFGLRIGQRGSLVAFDVVEFLGVILTHAVDRRRKITNTLFLASFRCTLLPHFVPAR